MDNHYYDAELNLDGTAPELLSQALPGYIESLEALEKIAEIISNPVEVNNPRITTERRLALRFLIEEARDDNSKDYNLGRVKKDVLDMGHSEESMLALGYTFEVIRQGFDHSGNEVTVIVRIDEPRRVATGSALIPLERFYNLSVKEFESIVGEILAHNMIESEVEV